MVLKITEPGDAKGALGELRAVGCALATRAPTNPLDVGSTKHKNPTNDPSYTDVPGQMEPHAEG